MQSMQVAAHAGWAMQQMQQMQQMQLQMQQMQQMQTGMLACKACAGSHRAHTCGRGTKRRALEPLVPNDCVAPARDSLPDDAPDEYVQSVRTSVPPPSCCVVLMRAFHRVVVARGRDRDTAA